MLLMVTMVFLLAYGWEFLIEDWFPILWFDENGETAEEHWEYVFTSVGFTFVGMLIPFYLIYKNFIRIHDNEQQLNRLNSDLQKEVDRQTREIRIEKEKAEAASASKSDFLARASHELRTPLNAILGFAQLMDIDPELNQDQKKHISYILEGGDHLLHLVNEILDLSTIESGKLKLNIQKIGIGKLMESLTPMFESMARQHHIRFANQISSGPDIFIQADEGRLKQVLLNLVSNAVKYNNTGGSVAISWKVERETFLRIAVVDTGLGIPLDLQKDLFEPFNRLNQRDSGSEGTGIGLVISKKLTEIMGGHLNFTSTLGKGSRFFIELPLQNNNPDETR